MPDFGEVMKSRIGAVAPYLYALSSAGLVLGNASGQACLTLGVGGGQSATFADGVNITGVLDQASAATMQIGINNATAITIGKAGVTTTNAGAFTSSQLLTASLGVTLGGGTAANGKIWYGSSAIQFGNNVGNVTDAGVWTLGPATTDGSINHILNAYTVTQVRGGGSGAAWQTLLSSSSSILIAKGVDASTNGLVSFRSQRSDGSNEVIAGGFTGAGAWTLGPSSGYTSLRHSIYCEETATAGSINKYIIVNVNGGTYKMAVYNA